MNRRITRRIISRSRKFSVECFVVLARRPHPDRVLDPHFHRETASPLPRGEGTALARRSLDCESEDKNPQTSILTGV